MDVLRSKSLHYIPKFAADFLSTVVRVSAATDSESSMSQPFPSQ